MKRSPSSPTNLHLIGYRILKETPARIFPLSPSIRINLIKAGIRVGYVVYVSSMFFWSMVTTLVGFGVASVAFGMVLPFMGISFPVVLAITFSILIGLASGGLTILIFYAYPNYVASNVKRELEKNLVYIANYMAILASAGATSEEVFASLARVGGVYGVRTSARSVVRDLELLGMDIVSALNEESKRTPSMDYGDFLQGYISTMRTGGGLVPFLLAMSEKFMESRKRLLDKMIDQLNMAGELFVVSLVALPIIMITIFSIMGFFGGEVMGGLSATQLMALTVYLLIPFAAVAVFVFIDMVMSSW